MLTHSLTHSLPFPLCQPLKRPLCQQTAPLGTVASYVTQPALITPHRAAAHAPPSLCSATDANTPLPTVHPKKPNARLLYSAANANSPLPTVHPKKASSTPPLTVTPRRVLFTPQNITLASSVANVLATAYYSPQKSLPHSNASGNPSQPNVNPKNIMLVSAPPLMVTLYSLLFTPKKHSASTT